MIPVHALTYYFIPQPIILQASAAYVPGFKLTITFSYNTGTANGVGIQVTRSNTATDEPCVPTSTSPGGTCWGGGYDSAFFQSDTVNQYDVIVTVTNPATENETISIGVTSHGQPDTFRFPAIPVVANYIQLEFKIITQSSPTDPTTIANLLDQRQQARDQQLIQSYQNLQATDAANHVDTQTSFEITWLGMAVIVGAVAYLLYKQVQKRE